MEDSGVLTHVANVQLKADNTGQNQQIHLCGDDENLPGARLEIFNNSKHRMKIKENPASTSLPPILEGTGDHVSGIKGTYSLAYFDVLRTLGRGIFARVHLVQSKKDQGFYALKVWKKHHIVKMNQVKHTCNEIKCLRMIKHPFLICFWGTFQDSKNLYMVNTFVEGGELFSLLRKSQVRI